MKKICALFLVLLLILSLAACGAPAPTGVHASAADAVPEKSDGPDGLWSLSEASANYDAGQLTLVLDADGFGYASITQLKRDFVYQDYLELSWSEQAIILDGVAGAYLQQGDSLIFTLNGEELRFVRSGAASLPQTPAPGSYQGVQFYEEGVAFASEEPMALSFAADGTGTYTSYGQTLPMTWTRYFLTVDDDQSFFFVCDGSTVTMYDGEYTVIYAAG